jgi:hypothetical protein
MFLVQLWFFKNRKIYIFGHHCGFTQIRGACQLKEIALSKIMRAIIALE